MKWYWPNLPAFAAIALLALGQARQEDHIAALGRSVLRLQDTNIALTAALTRAAEVQRLESDCLHQQLAIDEELLHPAAKKAGTK